MTFFESTAHMLHSNFRRLGRTLRRTVTKSISRKRYARHLRAETLESRRLLAADFQPFHHNRFDAEDVNDDGLISPMDTLAEAFNNPQLLEVAGIDTLLKYEASTQAQEVDLEVVESLRNALFGPPGSGAFADLAALNIQRGRDHGLADYNSTREAYGLPAVNSFSTRSHISTHSR